MDTIKINSKQAKIIAHRGLSGIECENTCPAFVAAGNRSYFGIETDVHKSKDGKFVIIHDETTQRVSLQQSNINVEESNYSSVSSLILPDLDKTTIRQDIRIPLLDEYIKICKKYNKICVLELKNHFEKKDLVSIINEIRKMDYIENVIFISFDKENCINLRNELPKNNIQWLIGNKEITEDIIKVLSHNKLDIDIYYKQLTKSIVDMLHSHGIKVNCWTCDDKNEAEQLVEFGVDFITTNILE